MSALIKWDDDCPGLDGSYLSLFDDGTISVYLEWEDKEGGPWESVGQISFDALIDSLCAYHEKDELEFWAAYFRKIAERLDAEPGYCVVTW